MARAASCASLDLLRDSYDQSAGWVYGLHRMSIQLSQTQQGGKLRKAPMTLALSPLLFGEHRARLDYRWLVRHPQRCAPRTAAGFCYASALGTHSIPAAVDPWAVLHRSIPLCSSVA